MEAVARPPAVSSTSSPLGAFCVPGGVNFSLYSRHATGVEILLFDHVDDAHPARAISIDPADRTNHYWHTHVPNVKAGQIYAYRVDGPYNPAMGMRFNPRKVLLDPYGRGVAVPRNYNRAAAQSPDDNGATAMKSVVVDPTTYSWEGDARLRLPSARTVIYEAHVRGFTRHPSSGLSSQTRGTYAGLIEKIPYLQRLGITAIELLPVFQFDHQDCPPGLVNYWGYQPISFFAPHQAYSSRRDVLGPIDEFRDMVKALHRAGIEVILDVVFNHTAEGGADGPTLSFRGIDNPTYYILEKDRSQYANYTGCGNTLNGNQPIVRRMILDSLRYWVEHMHVDGFRFDLASVLSRGPSGEVLSDPPILWDIDSDPVLAGTKLMAEAWDATGLYQVGSFLGDSWKEWNGLFRDDVRSFFRAEKGSLKSFADRFIGSPNIYGHKAREPEQSINFVTCHDGFTLNDVVSYDQKHNESNGEENRDGHNDNRSWNCGVEGPTSDPAIEKLRTRQVKNYLAATLLSIGIPMIVMGDEVRRSQFGNNNAYCHDNEIAWFDWGLLPVHAGIYRFASMLIKRRVQRTMQHERRRQSLSHVIHAAEKSWHGVKLNQPDWDDASHRFALTVKIQEEELLIHLVFNAQWDSAVFELPDKHAGTEIKWQRWIDTSLDPPNDITNWESAPLVSGYNYLAEARSVVALIAIAPRRTAPPDEDAE